MTQTVFYHFSYKEKELPTQFMIVMIDNLSFIHFFGNVSLEKESHILSQSRAITPKSDATKLNIKLVFETFSLLRQTFTFNILLHTYPRCSKIGLPF